MGDRTVFRTGSALRSIARRIRHRSGTVEQRFRFEKKLLHAKMRLFGSRDPILIYTMGKVGTTTLYRSLEHIYGKNAVIQVHFLNESTLANR